MTTGKFEDSKTILKNWREKNLIDYEKNKLTRKKVCRDISTNVHVIRVKQELTSDTPVNFNNG